MNQKYPNQIAAIKRKDKVFGIDAKLYPPTEKEDVPPLQMHSGFSRFETTIIDKSNSANTIVSANLPAEEIRYIKRQTDIALEQLAFYNTFWGHIVKALNHVTECIKKLLSPLLGGNTPADESNDNEALCMAERPAYKVSLRSTNPAIKGRPPAEILLENPSMKDDLLSMKGWLEQNLNSKFKVSNQQQIDAINDAICLLDIGELRPLNETEKSASSESENNMIFDIYTSDKKFKSSLKEGTTNHLIYGINIVCDFEKKYPFAVNIMNCYAPVVDGTNGQKIIKLSEATDTTNESIMMTSVEWYKVISRMEATLNMFESIHFYDAFEESKKNSYQHN
jgi:hypothetical protein